MQEWKEATEAAC